MKIIAVFSAVWVGVSLCPGVRAEVFNVRALGAKGDGTTYDTAAIQKALDACEKSGGTVEFPAGNYLSKPLTLHSHTTVRLDAGATLPEGFKDTAPYIVLLLVLIVRPQGLFGTLTRKKV